MYKKINNARFIFITFLVCFAPQTLGALVSIDDASSSHVENVGDFQAIGPFAGSSSNQGAVQELVSSKSNSLNFSVALSDLWSYLNASGVSSTPGLVFGYAANQKSNSPVVTISTLSFSFERNSGAVDTFALGSNQVEITDYTSGNSLAEAQFQIDLGFDFMQEYSAASNKSLDINVVMSNNNNGPDRLFLAHAFTTSPVVAYQTSLAAAVPLPPSILLYISGIVSVLAMRRSK